MPIAIGDIHGCLEPLQRLIPRLPEEAELIFLGDYIDRGPASAGVLRYLCTLAQERSCHFLRGNHEDMLLRSPGREDIASVWLANGGVNTLRSYGVASPQAWLSQQRRLDFLGAELAFLQRLAWYYEDDQAIYVHAGIDPRIGTMEAQNPQTLVWIREDFLRRGAEWRGKPIVFGHTPTQHLGVARGSVFHANRLWGIDTACVFGGRLTALDVETGRCWQENARAS